jgi:L-threonine-O-3-phosphate decarboxylase
MEFLIPPHGGNLEWAAGIAGCTPQQILDFSASINPLGCPSAVREILRSSELLQAITRYPDPSYTRLRVAIAAHHRIASDYILPGNGAAELLTWVCRDLAALDAVVLPVPAFGDYIRALKAASAKIQPITMSLPQVGKGNRANLTFLLPSSDREGSRGLLLNNPHNPTGILYERSEILPLLDRYDLVVIDEAFMDFLPPVTAQSMIDLVMQYPNLVILRSLTKFYALPGLRLGYAIAHPDRLQAWQAWRDPWSVNCVAEAAAIACLADGEFQQQTWDWLQVARSHLYDGLMQVTGLHPFMGAANFLLVASEFSVLALRDALLREHRMLIRDCLSFPELGDRFFRVCVKTIPDSDQLIAGLRDDKKLKLIS